MKESTDLEICKRIAEIENLKTSITSKEKGVWASMYPNECYGWYNPLTDDALCFQLMVKYGVTFDYYADDKHGIIYYGWSAGLAVDDVIGGLSRFVCIAIIQAHKGCKS